ncbi:MAG: GtrA family protein [Patescibacteria group bacterium]
MDRLGFYRASRYLAVGVCTFLIDLAIVVLLTSVFSIHYVIAVSIGFAVGISLNYTLSRRLVFRGTKRTVNRGYMYFLSAGLVSLTAILILVGIFVGVLGMPLIAARILASGIVGSGNYLFNLFLNFNVAGQHTLKK